MRHDIRHPAFEALIAPGTELQRFATNYRFVEGPGWHPSAEHLTFIDIAGDANKKPDDLQV